MVRTCEYVTVRKISMITNQNLVNKYLLHYFLFLIFSRTLCINWIPWRAECRTIYKNISKLKINKEKM